MPVADHRTPYDTSAPWNTPIGATPTIDPNSTNFINRIITKTPLEGQSAGVFANKAVLTSDVSQYTIPIYSFDNETPRASVQMSGYFSSYDAGDNSRVGYGFAATIPNVPIPAQAVSGVGSDGQITFWDAQNNVEWGFWQFGKDPNGTYYATNGFRYHTGSGYNGRFADGKAGRGAGTTYLSGLVRRWEIEQGHIDHALSMAYKGPSPECRYPASKSDGGNFGGIAGTDAPEGARVQLNPSLDVTTLGLSSAGVTIARALQQYGAYIIDNSGSTKVYIEDQTTANWPISTADPLHIDRYTVSAIPLNQLRVIYGPATNESNPACPSPQ
ncbi:hypothetical protein IPG36_00940 [bacterium]|nr:MAG: hypothetical protein IPG36_00940 [bacterium]